MNRIEALNILGLDEDATDDDIKAAYRECAQILHPDRFANNKKLTERATEQFKRLQEAHDYLTGGRAGKKTSARHKPSSHAYSSSNGGWESIEAKLAGLTAARTQLVAQRDALLDERRNALAMIAIGIVVAVALRRIVWIAGIAGTVFVWGIAKLINTVQSLSTIHDNVRAIDKQRRELEKMKQSGE